MKVLAFVLLMTTVAYADDVKTYDFKLDANDLNIISDGLQKEPLGQALPLVNKLHQQFMEQQPKPAAAPVDGKKDETAPVK